MNKIKTVAQLIAELQKIPNQNSILSYIGNDKNPEDEDFDISFIRLEIHGQDTDNPTLFFSTNYGYIHTDLIE